ncbi:MAG TPA: AsmA-like C-terminal region-containing protein [Xanthobacteraceae bacterium]
MQHALLGLGIALILAIAAALAAPAYIDWEDWRPTFERQATALVGAPVRIRGRIEASILPTPAFVLRTVEIGDAEKGTGLRAGEVRGILALGALLRGSVEAEEFVLVRPSLRLTVEPGGRPLPPAAGAAAAATDLVSFARIAIENGSLTIEDRAGGWRTRFDEISATGEINGRLGPTRIDASLQQDGRRWRVRANAGRFGEDRSGRVRLTLEQIGEGSLVDAEGTLALAGATPRFDGKLTVARRGAPGTPWQITANAQATEQLVSLEGIELAIGADAAPAELAGKVAFAPRRGGAIEGALSARRIDLDAVVPADAPKSATAALAAARDVVESLGGLPFRGRIGLAIDAVAAGGTTIREFHTDLALREGALAVERLEARLPGRGSIRAAGSGTASALFAGEAAIEAEDSIALARWMIGSVGSPEDSGPVRLAGRVEWKNDRLSVEKLDVTLGDAKVGGRVAFTAREGAQRASIEADLTASGVDLDRLAPFAQALTAPGAVDLALAIDGRALRVFGKSAQRVATAFSRRAEGVVIDRLAVEDFDGLTVRAHGKVLAPVERPSGTIDFDLQAARADGLAEIAARLAGSDASLLVRRVFGIGAPLWMKGSLSGAGMAAGIELAAQGNLSDIDASIDATFDLLSESLSDVSVTLEAREFGKLVALFGVAPGPPTPGSGSLEINLAKSNGGAVPASARLTVPGATVTADGELRQNGEGRIEPRLELRVEAADLRPLLAVVARSGGEAALPANGTARLVRTKDAFAFESIALNVGGGRARGAIAASGLDKPALGGKLSIERVELAGLLGLVFGNAADDKAFWPARLGPAPLAGASGAVDFEVGALGLVDRLTAIDARFRLKLGAADAAIEDFSADLAGGKLAGHARFVRGETLAFDGSAKFSGFDVARVLSPGTWRAAARGRGDVTLTLAGNGRAPAALAASLAGQGTLKLEALEIDRLDPNAVAAVFSATDSTTPPDEVGVVAALAPAFAKGPLKVAKIEAPLVVASGVMRTGKILASTGSADVSAAGNFDIARLAVDGTIEIEAPAPAGLTARPGATVRWRGPVAAPERGIEAAALATAITLRAMEQETKRIEERDRALPPRRSESPAPDLTTSIEAAVLPPLPPAASEVAAPAIPIPLPPARPRGARPPANTTPVEVRPYVLPQQP